MRIALYLRVSSSGQRDRQTIEAQRRALTELASSRGWTIVATFADDGFTAKAGHLEARAGFRAMLQAAVGGAFEAVLVVDIDRLTRSQDLAERGQVLGALQLAGVKLMTPAGEYDLRTTDGDLLVNLAAWKASADNKRRRDATVDGKRSAIARGRKPAGPTPYGYRYDRTSGAWSVHETEAAIVREIIARVAEGEASSTIADDLNARGVSRKRAGLWTHHRIVALVNSRTYLGTWTADKAHNLTMSVPVLVDAALWHQAQASFAVNGRRGLRRTRHVYLLEALAVCAICGAPIQIASALKPWRGGDGRGRVATPARYFCRAHRNRYGERCPLPYLKVADVDARLWAAVRALILEGDRLERAAGAVRAASAEDGVQWQQDLEHAQRQLKRLATTEAAILARFRRGAISDAAMDVELGAIGRERTMLEHQVAAATRATSRLGRRRQRAEGLVERIAELRRKVDVEDMDARRRLVEQLFGPGAVELDASGRIMANMHVSLAAGASTSSGGEINAIFRLVA